MLGTEEQPMSVREAILLAIPVFASRARGGLYAIRKGIEEAGVPRQLAAEIVEFLPLALARALLAGMGIHFEEHYVRQTARGCVIGQKLLWDEVVFREGLAIANEISGDGDAFVAVASWSVEYRAVNEAMNAGSRPEDLRCASPIIFAEYDDERSFDNTSGGIQPRAKLWWQFWR
jgi:hypothetical protein